MAELPYYSTEQVPDQAAPNNQERLVFVDPADMHGRQFEFQVPADYTRGGDGGPVEDQWVQNARADVRAAQEAKAAATPEAVATPEQLAKAVADNAETFDIMRNLVEEYGMDADFSAAPTAERPNGLQENYELIA